MGLYDLRQSRFTANIQINMEGQETDCSYIWLLQKDLTNGRAVNYYQHPSFRLRDFARFGDETFYEFENSGNEY